ncbi:MAG: 3-dehydroquinate synthase family protein [Phycisphaerales bacterium]
MTAPRHTVRVPLPGREYEVVVGRGVLSTLGESLNRALPSARRCLVVFDPNLPDSLVADVVANLVAHGLESHSLPLAATETNKQVAAATEIVDTLARKRFERTDLVVPLGGGIVGDTAGFAAAIYRRGIPFVQCPTTLLAMVDASVGGKTGVNLVIDGHLAKNMVGAFHQPALVLADLATLDSLPQREFRAGLAECLKHGMIGASLGDPDLWDATLTSLDGVIARRDAELAALIARNIALKSRVVVADEHESAPDSVGGRALLNLGHTFGHVIETLPALTRDGQAFHPLHGEAVGLGLIAASEAARTLGELMPVERVRAALETAGLPTTVGGLPNPQQLIDLMRHDKKSRGGRLRCIIPECGEKARVVLEPAESALAAGWQAIRD